ncbi:hypothetical protein Tco_1269202, partial [Tanacetum coccineum]
GYKSCKAHRECKFKGSKEGSRQEAGRGQDFKPVRTEKEGSRQEAGRERCLLPTALLLILRMLFPL